VTVPVVARLLALWGRLGTCPHVGGNGHVGAKVASRAMYVASITFQLSTDALISTTVETEDGHRIAVHIDGVGTPRANEPIVDLLKTYVSPLQPRSMIGSTVGKFGVSGP
jgi:hypothetical protein